MGKNTEEVKADAVEVGATEETPKPKKRKVLKKDFLANPGAITLTVSGVEGSKVYDPADLPQDIQDKLPAFALGHKLGDATSGKHGQEAADAIDLVWEGMLAGKWTTRVPAEPKITVSALAKGLENLDAEAAESARAALAALGITL